MTDVTATAQCQRHDSTSCTHQLRNSFRRLSSVFGEFLNLFYRRRFMSSTTSTTQINAVVPERNCNCVSRRIVGGIFADGRQSLCDRARDRGCDVSEMLELRHKITGVFNIAVLIPYVVSKRDRATRTSTSRSRMSSPSAAVATNDHSVNHRHW